MEKYPLSSKDIKTTIVNIDSRFRDGLMEKSSSTNFFHRFEHPYKNCIRLRVLTAEIPVQGIPVISTAKQNTSFYLKIKDANFILQTILVTIPETLYTTEQSIIDAIQLQFDNIAIQYGIFMYIRFVPLTKLVEIYTTGTEVVPINSLPNPSNPQPFEINFSTPIYMARAADWGLGYILGFRNKIVNGNFPIYDGKISIVSNCPINISGDPYVFLSLDDNYCVEHWTQHTLVQATAKLVVGTPRGAVDNGNGMHFSLNNHTVLMNDVVFPNPTDISRIRCKLIDMYGNIINMPYNEFSFSLEFTCVMNTLIHEKYKNNSFVKT